MTVDFWDSLQIILVILVLTSLSAYNYLSLHQLVKDKALSSSLLFENLFSFSLCWLSESLLIILIFSLSISKKDNPLVTYLQPIAAFAFAITLIISIGYFIKKKVLTKPLSVILLAVNLGLGAAYMFRLPLLVILRSALVIFVITFMIYSYSTYKLSAKASLLKVYYTLFYSIVLIVVNLLQNNMPLSLYLTITLCLCFFLTISLCLHYAEDFTLKLITTAKDIKSKDSELVEAEKRIQYLAYTHPDTGLKNAHKLHVDLKNTFLNLTGVCMLNIKNFKLLLTLTGYRESKLVMEEIAKALLSQLGIKEDIYHFSTDRFIILYRGPASGFEPFVKDILSIFSKTNLCTIDLNPCIGATYIRTLPFNYDTVVQELELASHVSKRSPSRYSLYEPDMSRALQSSLELESKLKEATKNNEWEVYFQPKVNVINNQIMGAEALIRWRGQETSITPNVFIPLAEKLGLISEIGRYVIHTTFRYTKELRDMGFDGLKFSINLSVQQLMELDLVEYIQASAIKLDIDPESIIFEVTESIFIHNMSKVNNTIMQLKSLGFKFSLDDFGTGYSSLAYLSKLHFDELKFDREFIQNIQFEKKNLVILECVTKMGQDLGLEIVTEGIEDEMQYKTIKSLGCNYYQGYFYSRPIPFTEFLCLLQASVA